MSNGEIILEARSDSDLWKNPGWLSLLRTVCVTLVSIEIGCKSKKKYTSLSIKLYKMKIVVEEKQEKKEESKVHLAKKGNRSSLLWKGGHFSVGLTRKRLSKRKGRTIFTKLRVERANSRSDVDTYVRFRVKRRRARWARQAARWLFVLQRGEIRKTRTRGCSRDTAPLGDRWNGKYF